VIQSSVGYHREVYWQSGTTSIYTIYINDLADMDTGDYRLTALHERHNLLADDAKICRHITCRPTDDYQILQETVDKIQH